VAANADLGDGALLESAGTDPAAFRVFFERWVAPVTAYAMRRTLDPEVAADITAEVFAVAYLKRRRFRDSGRGAGPWIYGIARRELGRHRRRRAVEHRALARLGVTPPALDDASARAIEALVDVESYRRELEAALTGLSAAHREAVRLRVVEDRSYPEVARLLGCSEGAARVRVHRALQRLADSMEVVS